jgi:hypothetical protein
MAEVKVKITAANQTQTGFQSVLADAQKTATQVQQTFARAADPGIRMFKPKDLSSGEPIKIDIGDYGLEPLRELQERVRALRESARQSFDTRPAEQFNGSIAGMLGRFALLIGAAATVGKVIASAFDQASAAVKQAIGIQEQFNKALVGAGQSTSISGAIGEFRQLNGLAEQTGKTLEQSFGRNFGEALANAASGRPQQLLGRIGSLLSGNAPIRDIKESEARQRAISLNTLDASLETQINNLRDSAATGGDKEAAEVLRIQQERKAQIQTLIDTLQQAGVSDGEIQKRVQKINEASALQDEISASDKRLEAERQITAERDKQAAASAREAEQAAKRAEAEQERTAKARRSIDQDIAMADAKLRGDKQAEENLLQQRDFDRAIESGATFEQAASLTNTAALQRQIDAARAAEGQGRMVGSFGASSLQRIGFASNEFFDTRQKKDPAEATERATAIIREIFNILKKGEPLVLPSSN